MNIPPLARASDTSAGRPGSEIREQASPNGRPVTREPDWAAHRRASPLNDLLNPTVRWAASLPPAIRPMTLLNRFPRLANLVAASWKEPLSFRACLDDLVTDRRGGRQGLPVEVHEELNNLRRYYYFREFPDQATRSSAPKSKS